MKKPKFGEEQTLPLLCFAILASLAMYPTSALQLARRLQVNHRSIRSALSVLEDYGWIVRRFDKKWVIRVLLAPMAVPLPNKQGDFPKLEYATVGDDPVLGHNLAKQLPASGKKQWEPYTPPTVPTPAHVRLADAWNVPDTLPEHGVLRLDKIKKCALCMKRSTPLHYGATTVCPKCARGENV